MNCGTPIKPHGKFNFMQQLNIFKDKKVLVTGHTGFKGSWLSIWLHSMGAKVCGFSLDPETTPNLFDLAGVKDLVEDNRGDIRNLDQFADVVNKFQPEFVFHLAAQAIVRRSYNEPKETFNTNVMGTVNCLDALRDVPSVRSIVVITTDKCYKNEEWDFGYRETDALGGHDPYSASKAAAEIAVAAYRNSFFNLKGIGLASARAGNVIGGGDWSTDRIIPDIVRALEAGDSIPVRSPKAIRPWQHVLEPLCGYLLIASNLYDNYGKDENKFADAWNFGPSIDSCCTVGELVGTFINAYGSGSWDDLSVDQKDAPHEAGILKLSWDKAHQHLRWSPKWNFEETIRRTASWHKNQAEGKAALGLCLSEINDYCNK